VINLKSRIKEIREEAGFSRPKFAEMVDVHWETIKAYEVKGAYPSLKVAFKIAKALDVKIEDLYENVD
jgi:putative transcriptional regulator